MTELEQPVFSNSFVSFAEKNLHTEMKETFDWKFQKEGKVAVKELHLHKK